MSIRIMSRCWDHTTVTGTHLLLLLALADFANDAGVCWPSLARLAQRTRISERQVQRGIANLAQAGEVLAKTVRGRGRHNLYLIVAAREEEDLTRALVEHFEVSPLEALSQAEELLRRQREYRYGERKGDTDDTFSDDDPEEKPDIDDTFSENKGDIRVTFSGNGAGSPADEKVTSEVGKGDISGTKGDIAMSPPLTVIKNRQEPSENRHLDILVNDGSAHTRARTHEAPPPPSLGRPTLPPSAGPPLSGEPLPFGVWPSIRDGLRLRMPYTTWNRYVRDLDAERTADGAILVIADSAQTVEFLHYRLAPLFQAEIKQELQRKNPDFAGPLTLYFVARREIQP